MITVDSMIFSRHAKEILQKRSSDDEENLREVEEKNRWLLQIVEICS